MCCRCRTRPATVGQGYCPECAREYRLGWKPYGSDHWVRRKAEREAEAAAKQVVHIGRLMAGEVSFRLRKQARKTAHRAMQRGTLVKKPCELCGNPKSTMHHEDYAKRYDVRWLCRPHHREADRARYERLYARFVEESKLSQRCEE